MRVKALTIRILRQMRRDKRTLALMIFAPLLVLTLVYFLLDSSTSTVNIAVVNAPESYVESLYENNTYPSYYAEDEARRALENEEVTAIVDMKSGKLYVALDGSNSTKSKMALSAIETAKKASAPARIDLKTEIDYVYGYEDLSMFDNMGAAFVGVLVFFFVFLIAGIAFLQERTTGTLEKLLSTPIKRWEIVLGYTCGYGIVTVIQSSVISLYVVYALDVMMIGSLWLVLLITLLTAIAALTLGILLSTAANNEFQMIQFIPVVIVPQIFLCGLFELSPTWDVVGHITPLYYVADALNEVMIKGSGIREIWLDLAVISLCCAVFMTLNTILLKKYRRI